MTNDDRTPPDPSGPISNAWQLAHVLSEQIDDAAPMNMNWRWIPLAERLWPRLHPVLASSAVEREELIAAIRVPIKWGPYGEVLQMMPDAEDAGDIADALLAAGYRRRTEETAEETKDLTSQETGLREVVYFQAVCQCCGEACEDYGDFSAMAEPARAIDCLPDAWCLVDGLVMCEECWVEPGEDADSDDEVRAHDVHPTSELGTTESAEVTS